MNWRVIVKLSFTGDEGSSLRNHISKNLKACGLRKSKMTTATWEGTQVSADKAAQQLGRVLDVLSDPSKLHIRWANLDHLWIYIDRAKPPKAKPIATAK